MHNLLEILILILRKFTKLPVLRYLDVCNILYIWSIRAIPTHRVYRLYDNTVFIQIVAAATINFSLAGVRLLIEGSY